MNAQGWTAFISLYQNRYEDFVYSIARGLYHAILETHFSTYVPGATEELAENLKLVPNEHLQAKLKL